MRKINCNGFLYLNLFDKITSGMRNEISSVGAGSKALERIEELALVLPESIKQMESIMKENKIAVTIEIKFMGIPFRLDPDCPSDEIRFADREGNCLARITNVG